MTALLAATVVAATPWMSLNDAARASRAAELKRSPLDERLLRITEGFLGTPYVLSPLGEGKGKDPDPLVRWDAVDCVTMAEEVMALALAPDDKALVSTLTRLRYSGEPAWERRNHLTEAQWLPHLVNAGVLRPVTKDWAGDATRHAKKKLTKATWKEKGGKALGLPAAAQPTGEFPIDLLPAEVALEKLAKAPSGLLVVVARADRSWLVTRVTHMGFLVQGKSGPLLRHASRSHKKVVDEPLAQYLKRNRDYGTWTIEGLSLYEVREPK